MSQATQRESLEVDVLYVGAGPASLASALHLMNRIRSHNAGVEHRGGEPIEPPTILVIEKGAAVGEHVLSGAVMNPVAIGELVPDWREQGFPIEHVCTKDYLYLFTRKRHFVAPITPPQFRKKGYPVVSISKVVKWLAERCEAAGVEIYPGFAGDKLLVDGNRVVGVRTGDMGLDKQGKPKANFQPGMDIYAKVTVLGEGVLGTLTKQLVQRFGLEGSNPQVYETGIKEIWRIRPEKHRPGRVIHGMGWPNYFEPVSGMWLYDLQDNQISLGYVAMLDAESPWNNPHLAMQQFKTHPFVRDLLEGAELVKYGARAIPTGGIYAQPKLYADGALLVGDSAGFCNAEKLSGIHMAMKSGMMAAETIVDALRGKDTSSVTLGGYAERYRHSWAWREHMEARNFHGSFEKGPVFFMLNQPFRMLTRGRGLLDPIRTKPGWAHYKKLAELAPEEQTPPSPEFDRKLTFDRETLVQFSGAQHDVDQPSHLVVADTDLCRDVCTEEYGNPCEHFCPAHVYEMVPDDQHPGKKKLLIHHENCVHCKTCDIADPYQVITWTPPEGGQGIDYTGM
jgi:electron-transferring-flavoprotein dehydrogenase